jgi:hypothetical protein
MTPAAKPSIVSSTFRLTALVKKTSAEPSAVTAQQNIPASSACRSGEI